MTSAISKTIFVIRFSGDFSGIGSISTDPIVIDSVPAYPVIKELSGISITMGDYEPSISGSVTIDNSTGSLGFQRRFSDLLDSKDTGANIGATAKIYCKIWTITS